MNGITALHPGSSTFFLAEEIPGSKSKTHYRACGVVAPRGMCVETAMVLGSGLAPDKESTDPGDLPGTWVMGKGQLGAPENSPVCSIA